MDSNSNACCSNISEVLSTVTNNETDAGTCGASVSTSEDELLTKLLVCVSKNYTAILEEKEQLRSETARESWIENFLDQEENGPREEEERQPRLSWFGLKPEQTGSDPDQGSARSSSRSSSTVSKIADNKPVPIVFTITIPENDSKKTGRRRQGDEDETTFRQLIQPSTLAPITQLPNFLGYVSTRRNIVVEDERVVPYYPYLGEKVLSSDFHEQLLAQYDFNTNYGKDEKEEADVFYKLVQAVAQEENRLVPYQAACGSPISEAVFKAISISCPNMGSPDELKEKFLKMEAPSTAIPNIDGPNAQLKPVEKTMEAYTRQFCRRCFMYGCLLHHHTDADSVIPKKKGKLQTETRQDLEAENKICGPDCCYRLDEFASNRNSSRNDSVNVNNDVDVEMEGAASSSNGVIWSEGDKSFFLVVRKINPNDFCGIAKLMMTKNITCREVYLFAKNEGYIVPDAVGPGSETPKEQQSKGTKEFEKKWRDFHTKQRKDQKKKTKNESEQSQRDDAKAKKLKAGKEAKSSKAGQEVKNSKADQKVKNSKSGRQVKKCDTIIRHHFVPCDHPGISCETSSCPCFARGEGNFCEKYCNCSSECINRFLGCDCRGRCDTKSCRCLHAMRECDPDLCKKCGADQPTDVKVVKCKNVRIQRGMVKHTLRGPSDVSGWGLFLKDSAQKDDLIIEYTGEIISNEEVERRGFTYDRVQCSYMFTINEEYVVDAQRKGNKSRFANSSSTKANCYALVLMVNGDHRIGLYAMRNIAPGEEILFDYGKAFSQKCVQYKSK